MATNIRAQLHQVVDELPEVLGLRSPRTSGGRSIP